MSPDTSLSPQDKQFTKIEKDMGFSIPELARPLLPGILLSRVVTNPSGLKLVQIIGIGEENKRSYIDYATLDGVIYRREIKMIPDSKGGSAKSRIGLVPNEVVMRMQKPYGLERDDTFVFTRLKRNVHIYTWHSKIYLKGTKLGEIDVEHLGRYAGDKFNVHLSSGVVMKGSVIEIPGEVDLTVVKSYILGTVRMVENWINFYDRYPFGLKDDKGE